MNQLFYQPEISNGYHFLTPEESRHAVKVLRMGVGDALDITDGKGMLYHARITEADFSKCGFAIVTSEPGPSRNYHIHIAIAPTKNSDRIEWFTEKAVELGVDEISFLACRNSERRSVNMDRIERTAIAAMKQSQQVRLPTLNEIVPFEQILSISAQEKFIAFVDQKNPVHLQLIAKPLQRYLVLVGPEGDFSPDELSKAEASGFQKVSLGSIRLRTETAGIAACHILNLKNQV